MSLEITTAFVDQFKSNVMMLSQQKGSRLSGSVMIEPITGKSGYIEQIGPTSTITRTSRHGDSPLVSTPHDRRRVFLEDEEWGDLIDKADRVRTLIDPTNPYAVNAGWAFGRAKDDKIIAAFDGTAFTGQEGGTSTAYDTSNDIGSASSNDGLTIQKLIDAKSIFGVNDVDPDEELYLAVSQKQIDDLLAITQITSADYNNVKALVEGKVDTFMGFKFIRTQRLGIDANDIRKCFAWTKSGMALGVGAEVQTRIAERADKSFSTYVYLCMCVGATRLDEQKVVRIFCDESPD